MKICARCKSEKDVGLFNRDRSKRDGLNKYCRDCSREIGRADAIKMRDTRRAYYTEYALRNGDKIKAKEAARRLKSRAAVLIANARTRAKKKGLEFDLGSCVDLIQGQIDAGACEMTGIKFDLSPGRSFASPSIDRVESSGGYTYGNIRIVCHAMNSALGDWGEADLKTMVSSWLVAMGPEAAKEVIAAFIDVYGLPSEWGH